MLEQGDNRLYHADCFDAFGELGDDSVDMVFADVPYGTTACKWDTVIDLEAMWVALRRVVKPKGAIVMTASQPFTSRLVASNYPMFRCEWIWHKNAPSNFGTMKYHPAKQHESVLVFGRQGTVYYPIKEEREGCGKKHIGKVYRDLTNRTDDPYAMNRVGYERKLYPELRYPSSVRPIKCHKNTPKRRLHPAVKPVALCEYFIKTYSLPGETVLDFTMGSGTTGVACVNLGRRFIGIEKEQKYYDIACDRIFF